MSETIVIIANPQQRVKDSYAASPAVGLAVRANGEEVTSIIDGQGNVFQAGIEAPTAAPTVVDGGSGNLTDSKYVGYIYAYAATTAYPYVNTTLAINGSLAPRSNQSPSVVYQITDGGGRQNTVTVTKTTRADIDKIWIFRTDYFASSDEAQTAVDAGIAFYIGEVDNDGMAGTVDYTDNAEFTGVDQIELDNFVAPTAQFVVYADPYFWMFGNFPFIADATWETTGVITVAGGQDQWFTGRSSQNISIEGVTEDGYDGHGTFKFRWLTNTTAQLTLDGTSGTDQTLDSSGNGKVTIQGPATTLYRSKPRNPLSWGYTQVIGTSLVPQQYAFLVGGGLGTALAVVPTVSLLKLDCELPTACYTLNLHLAGTSGFEQTLRLISSTYSISSHWSQFPASTSQGFSVLWGIDYKNFAILQCNGVTQLPISGAIPRILRRLTADKGKQLLAHGVYDPRTELNCLWVTRQDSVSLVNYLIYQHAPTGYWGFVSDLDVLCSASIYDTKTNNQKTFVGTQTGFFGQALVDGLFKNWLPFDGTYQGIITSATGTSITITDGSFNTTDDGVIGNWCLITDPNEKTEQWARISAVAEKTLTFDVIIPYLSLNPSALLPVPVSGWKFYIGLIECSLRKDFDLDTPLLDKKLSDFGVTQLNSEDATFVRFYRDRENTTPLQFAMLQKNYDNGDLSDFWVTKQSAPQLKAKSFGIEAINRSYSDWKFINFIFNTNITA